MKILGIILARAGSKRIPFKNKKFLGKKRLFNWTLDVCKKLSPIKDFIVSTDDKQIFNISKKRGFLVPWLRPKKLSTDKSTSYSACLHAIKWYEKNINIIDAILLLQVTSPFRSIKSVLKTINLFTKLKTPVVSVTRMGNKEKIQENNIFKIKKNKIYTYDKKSKSPKYKITGSIYLWPKDTLFNDKCFKLSNAHAFIINNKKQSLDLDTQEDWKKAEYYIKKEMNK